MEAVLPVELEVPSLRVALESEIPKAGWTRGRFEQLHLIEEQRMNALYHTLRMNALYHTECSKRKIAKAFHKKVKIRHVQQGGYSKQRESGSSP